MQDPAADRADSAAERLLVRILREAEILAVLALAA